MFRKTAKPLWKPNTEAWEKFTLEEKKILKNVTSNDYRKQGHCRSISDVVWQSVPESTADNQKGMVAPRSRTEIKR